MRSFTAGDNDAGVRLSRFVLRVTTGLPTSLLYKSFRNKRIKVNGRRAAPEQRLAAGDRVELYINDEFFAPAAKEPPFADNIPLPDFSVVFEDGNIAILQKPAGVLSHRGEREGPTLLDAFTARQIKRGEYDPAAENTFSPALCNRLDRGTEGLVVAAKNYSSLRDMNALIQAGALRKFYRCITVGAPAPGRHEGWLVRDYGEKQVSVTQEPPAAMTERWAQRGQARSITTAVEVVERCGGLALCEIELVTGRTHQIRAHLAALGAPLLGDMKYGNDDANRAYGQKGQALCAFSLCFTDELPAENTLSYLAGRSFEAVDATLPLLWQSLKNTFHAG